MSTSLWSIWNTAARLGLAMPTAAELALLILLGASLLALRAFRDNYFKVWVLGWATFVASRLAEHCFAPRIPAPFDLVAVQATFVLAVGLLAGAVLLYTRDRDLIVPLMVITPHPGGLCRSPNPVVAGIAAPARGRRGWLPDHPADRLDRAAARAPRTVGARGVAARLVFAVPPSFVVALHRSRAGSGIPGRGNCARPEHAARGAG